MSRTVVVTGGSRGIGRAAVERFAAAGERVIALGRNPPALAALAALGVETHVCDVTDERAVTAVFAEIGDVDVLVNNAGMGESAPLHTTTLESWRRHLDVNATGPFLCMRAVVPGMRDRESGAVVTVASTAGRAGVPYTTAYSASKHAVIGLTRAVASEVAGTGVRVNAQAEAALAAAAPLGRLLEPHEVADAVVFLASPAAAAINGQAVVIDGGGIQA
jgi:NAD(P)-dependent dehydrogenase (short-subunit alcohol dehydrogenase family)